MKEIFLRYVSIIKSADDTNNVLYATAFQLGCPQRVLTPGCLPFLVNRVASLELLTRFSEYFSAHVQLYILELTLAVPNL